MTPAPLTVHNAEITTAAVEVKTLTIKGKQVTLAVFRQIKSEPLFNEDLSYRGSPWGTVNYHTSGCSSLAHVHVVWQFGAELRSTAVRKSDLAKDRVSVPSGSHHAGLWLAAFAVTRGSIEGAARRDGNEFWVTVRDVDLRIDKSSDHAKWVRLTLGEHDWDLRGVRPVPDASPDVEARLRVKLDAAVDVGIRDYQRRWLRWQEIESLPQLFIAV